MKLEIGQSWDGQPVAESEVTRLELRAGESELEIRVDAPWAGDPPPESDSGSCWGLWEHEVVELFICGSGERYTEIELGPHGHHLVLGLSGVRMVEKRELPLDYDVERVDGRWRGVARLSRQWIPTGPHRINAYAIRGTGAMRRYLAWQAVPGPEPDFHRLDCFVDVGRALMVDSFRDSGEGTV